MEMTTRKTSVGIFIFAGCIIVMLILSTTLVITHGYFLEATGSYTRKINFEEVAEGVRVTWQRPSEIYYENVSYTRKINFEEVAEGVRVTWQRPSEIYYENVGYKVTYNSTMGSYSTTTNYENITIPMDTFCYFFDIEIDLLPSLIRKSVGHARYYDTISDVESLYLIPSEGHSVVAIIWTSDPLQQQCNLSYEVISIESEYSIDTITVFQTPEVLDLIYCIDANVTVRTIFNNRKSHGSVCSYPEVYPSLLEPFNLILVNNVSIMATDITALLSWEIPTSLRQCTNLFTVTATNEETNEQNECKGITSCEIILRTTFCPYTEFIIRPTSPFEGDEIKRRYSCAEHGIILST
ncbi:hypothetical protein QE152_g40757 [Popillia japonica]|uniref:Uncharacterized protein n=1 Tax=Popillia japonica TaxID=7064 RepID=A0AAW1HFC0_POPJA